MPRDLEHVFVRLRLRWAYRRDGRPAAVRISFGRHEHDVGFFYVGRSGRLERLVPWYRAGGPR